jgi:hypothetical protein
MRHDTLTAIKVRSILRINVRHWFVDLRAPANDNGGGLAA